jgi:hypothetical protein
MARRQHKNRMSARMLGAAERQLRALELKKKDWTYQQIADELGYANPMGAWCAVKAGLRKGFVEAAEELRAIEEIKLDAAERRLWPLIDRRVPHLGAIDRLLAIAKRRAALLGLDAPGASQVTQAAVTADATESLTHEERLAKLVALLETAPAGQAASGAGEVTPAAQRAILPDAVPNGAHAADAVPA